MCARSWIATWWSRRLTHSTTLNCRYTRLCTATATRASWTRRCTSRWRSRRAARQRRRRRPAPTGRRASTAKRPPRDTWRPNHTPTTPHRPDSGLIFLFTFCWYHPPNTHNVHKRSTRATPGSVAIEGCVKLARQFQVTNAKARSTFCFASLFSNLLYFLSPTKNMNPENWFSTFTKTHTFLQKLYCFFHFLL